MKVIFALSWVFISAANADVCSTSTADTHFLKTIFKGDRIVVQYCEFEGQQLLKSALYRKPNGDHCEIAGSIEIRAYQFLKDEGLSSIRLKGNLTSLAYESTLGFLGFGLFKAVPRIAGIAMGSFALIPNPEPHFVRDQRERAERADRYLDFLRLLERSTYSNEVRVHGQCIFTDLSFLELAAYSDQTIIATWSLALDSSLGSSVLEKADAVNSKSSPNPHAVTSSRVEP